MVFPVRVTVADRHVERCLPHQRLHILLGVAGILTQEPHIVALTTARPPSGISSQAQTPCLNDVFLMDTESSFRQHGAVKSCRHVRALTADAHQPGRRRIDSDGACRRHDRSLKAINVPETASMQV